MGERYCERCGAVGISSRHHLTRFCGRCSEARGRDSGAARAHQFVRRAVKAGKLPDPATLACADCGGAARDYDHRDYGKPLQVEAVCRSCNKLRGPARPVLTFELPDEGVVLHGGSNAPFFALA